MSPSTVRVSCRQLAAQETAHVTGTYMTRDDCDDDAL